ncbi:hypothetical protein PWT90_01747 [Aphanocladium album]|nr:hypothetical protein PWT90_01747 [Aphanocladium album]
MAAVFQPAVYNQLPSLEEAQKLRDEPFVNDVINGPIRDLFLKYASDAVFCLYLQHRHHKLSEGEKIVKVGGTAHLMDGQQMKDVERFGNKIVPTTWMTSDGTAIPMEFASVPSSQKVHFPSGAFMAELATVLRSNGCEDMFGIDTVADSAWSELSVGNASVVVPCSDDSEFDKEEYIPVAFAFQEDKPAFIVHGRCGSDHKHTKAAN